MQRQKTKTTLERHKTTENKKLTWNNLKTTEKWNDLKWSETTSNNMSNLNHLNQNQTHLEQYNNASPNFQKWKEPKNNMTRS